MSVPVNLPSMLEHAKFVNSLAGHLVNADTAEDLAQEAWVAALQRPPEDHGALKAWFRSTQKRLAAKWTRGDVRRQRREHAAAKAESLPSTDQLVTKLELEQRVVRAVMKLREGSRQVILLRYYEELSPEEIAKRLDVTVGAVRARLFRAIEELRATLDRAYGNRENWMRGLVVWHSAPVGGSVLDRLTHLLKEKTSMTTNIIGGAAATLVTTVGLVWVTSSGNGAEPGNPMPLVMQDQGVDEAVLAQDEKRQEIGVDQGGDDVGEDIFAIDAEVPTEGRLAFALVDDVSGKGLRDFEARFLHETRFGIVQGWEKADVRITTGEWTGVFLVNGYEPLIVEEIAVDEDETTNLGTLRMVKGSSSIEGIVNSTHLQKDATVLLELHGRVPAGKHFNAGATPPSTMKYPSYPLWRMRTKVDERFRFEGLPAGNYWLRARAKGAVPSEQHLEVKAASVSWAPQSLSGGLSLSFNLTLDGGQPFDGEALLKAEGESSRTLFFEVLSGKELIGYKDYLLGEEEDEFGFMEGIDEEETDEEGLVDRERREGDVLIPSFPRPRASLVQLQGKNPLPNLFEIEGFPRKSLVVKVSFGELIGEIDLDLTQEVTKEQSIVLY